MARIDLKTSQIGSFGTGDLQLQNGVAMDGTLRLVTDAVNTASPLKLSTALVQTTSTLKITTADNPYIDAEDNSGNNRFTVGRDPASQQVNVDFASNPSGSTTAVGAIRTYRDGTNLSEAMTFREDGNVGIGTNAPTELLDVSKNQASPTRVNISNTDVAGTSTLRFSNASGAASALFENATNQFTFQNAINSGVIRFQTTNAGGTTLTAATITGDQDVGIGTTAPVGRLHLYKAASATRLAIDGDAGQNRLISYRTGAVQRFGLYVNNTAESGSNVGSDFAVRAYNDAGTLLSTPLFIQRSTGNVGIGTTTPATVLDVVGSDFMIFANNSAGNRIVKIGVQPGVGEPAIQATLSNGTARQLSLNPSGGNVGIGTTTPLSLLEVSAGTTIYPINITSSNASPTTTGISMGSFVGAAGGANGSVYIASSHDHGSTAQSDMVFYTHTGSALTEKGRFLSTGGLTFNGDTAAANALDDYEEGTWTPSVAFGGASVGVVLSVANGATYTKIGRQVTVNGFFAITSKGSSTGAATITGLPFTIGNGAQFYAAASLFTENISFVNVLQGRGDNNTTVIQLFEVTVLGALTTITDADFANNSNINLSLTYFV
jgi:hypothetical protein